MDKQDKQKAEQTLRTIIIFVVLIALGYAGGAAIGRGGAYIRRMELDIPAMKQWAYDMLSNVLPVIYCGINLFFFLPAYFLLFRYIRQSKGWDGEDEQYIKAVENGLSNINNLAGVVIIVDLILYEAGQFLGTRDGATREMRGQIFSVCTTVLIVSLVLSTLMQALILRYIKKINPEKKGNIFALNFQKTWMASCDEAEQMILFRAGYKAHRTVNIICIICYCALLVLETILQVGLVPLVLVGIIWLTNAIAFARESRKLDK